VRPHAEVRVFAPKAAGILAGIAVGLGLALALPAGSSSFRRAAKTCPSPTGAEIVATVGLGGRPGFLLLAKNTLWVAIAASRPAGRGALARVDAPSGRLLGTLPLPIDPDQLASGFGSLWVTGETSNRSLRALLRIDPHSGRMQAVIRGPRTLGSKIAATSDGIWVGGADIFPEGHPERAGVRFVYKIDPRRNAVVRQVRLPGGMTVIDLQGEGSSLWATGWFGVAKISASGRLLFHQSFNGSGWSMALTPGVVWIAEPWFARPFVRRQNRPARRLLRIATSEPRRVTVIELQTQPGAVSAAGGTVWVGANGGLARINAAETPPTLAPVPVSLAPNYHESFPEGVWVSELHRNRVDKIC
jgi:hypothetical protein